MNENKKNAVKIGENDLEQVSGGENSEGGGYEKCWFENPQGQETRADQTVWLKCGATHCHWLINRCSCFETDFCESGWHKIHGPSDTFKPEILHILYHHQRYNHIKKIPWKGYKTD